MTPHRFVVLADHVRGFDAYEDAEAFARANVPAVLCERIRQLDGTSVLVEVIRNDVLYDAERDEWRVMMG